MGSDSQMYRALCVLVRTMIFNFDLTMPHTFTIWIPSLHQINSHLRSLLSCDFLVCLAFCKADEVIF